ncbi:MAG: ferrous iron transport protein B [Candidatus Sumerlaeia bacterium]|nr:ferrous iron transport protein B [Candidatus Sumerlaeia bacterium]
MTNSPQTAAASMRVVLLGNPNTGKTTLFNALTGHRARVGNYAGVTVEKREGPLRDAARAVTLVDLPGTYSLAAHSADEFVAVEVLLGLRRDTPRPDAVVVVADASNLERNLFLATQVLDLGLPTIVALNMIDVAEKDGLRIDAAGLSLALGVPVVPTNARDRKGVTELAVRIADADRLPVPTAPAVFPPEFVATREALATELAGLLPAGTACDAFAAGRVLLEVDGTFEERLVAAGGEPVRAAIGRARESLETAGHRLRALEARSRYQWIRTHVAPHVKRPAAGTRRASQETTERIDRVLTHRIWGSLIFLLLMGLVFQAIYTWSAPLMDGIEGVFALLGDWLGGMLPEGALQSLVVNGIVAGVGGVMVFLPQILVLFLFIALLEDVGYMARAAFLMDRLLSRFGLSGRSFIPMLSSFACAIPGIMATRTIENPRDRLATILIAPLMSCSARLPVYTLMIAAFVPEGTVAGFLSLQGLVLLGMYLVGIGVSAPVTWILKRTLLKSRTPNFLIELPPYRKPLLSNVFSRMVDRGREFLVRAGTIILAVAIVVWALSYYPRPAEVFERYESSVATANAPYLTGLASVGVAVDEAPGDAAGVEALADAHETVAVDFAAWAEELAALEFERDGELLRRSALGTMGRAIEPLVRPLGWDWRIGMAAIASFPAREVVIAVLGVIFDLGPETDEEDPRLKEKLQAAEWPDGRPLFNLPVALSLMVFFALCLQCAATIAIIKRETNSWRWPLFAFGYMTALAYIGAFLVYRVSSLLL